MKRKAVKKVRSAITFEACLKQSTPSAKPLKFGPEGESEISLEADASQKIQVIKLLAIPAGKTFKVTVELC
jgi:hypothetical protein